MSCTNPASEYEALLYLAQRLELRFPYLDETEILAMIAEELEPFSNVKMRYYVPLLVERNLVERLRRTPLLVS
ncbi:three-helix bundle dimerization domain-containing protein [Microbacterium sp. NPDC076911]|uniref:three-helix bundle dimerization domain-containing protein n=1 Tax=Microbacterium sp. NPDC076911 TaxID=3154958 RepID=UPI003432D3A4